MSKVIDYEIVRYKTDNGSVELSSDTVKRYLVSGQGNVTDAEIMMFLKLCESQKLNPWVKDAYLIKYNDKSPATMVTGKDVFIKRAMKHPAMDGIKSGVALLVNYKLVYREGNIILKTDNLVGGWCEVYRKDMKYPFRCEASYAEFAQPGQNGRRTSWDKMPGLMIAKVATSQALRLAFPEDFCGLYDEAEMKTELPEDKEPMVVDYIPIEKDTLNAASGALYEEKPPAKHISPSQAKYLFNKAGQNKDVIIAAIGKFGYKSSKEILEDDFEWIGGLLDIYAEYGVVDPAVIDNICNDLAVDGTIESIKNMIKNWHEVDIERESTNEKPEKPEEQQEIKENPVEDENFPAPIDYDLNEDPELQR
jgi:phage recombination protein Bet